MQAPESTHNSINAGRPENSPSGKLVSPVRNRSLMTDDDEAPHGNGRKIIGTTSFARSRHIIRSETEGAQAASDNQSTRGKILLSVSQDSDILHTTLSGQNCCSISVRSGMRITGSFTAYSSEHRTYTHTHGRNNGNAFLPDRSSAPWKSGSDGCNPIGRGAMEVGTARLTNGMFCTLGNDPILP